MNVLLTGASGFLGSRILSHLTPDHSITTLGRMPLNPSLNSGRHLICDLAQDVPVLLNEPVDWVVHAAGKAHSVPRNARELADYERVNVQGTAHLLTALEHLPHLPKALVHISTVLVYGRQEGHLLDETTPLNARDAYGPSKVRAEAVVREWAARTGVSTTILRLPLIVADPPAGNVAALMRAIRRGYYVRIGTGAARRSMVRADDVAAVIVRAAGVGGTFQLTDGCHPSVAELENALARRVGRKPPMSVPLSVANAVATVGDGINALTGRTRLGRRFPLDSITLQKLTGSLTFSDEAARHQLHWRPRPVLDLFR